MLYLISIDLPVRHGSYNSTIVARAIENTRKTVSLRLFS